MEQLLAVQERDTTLDQLRHRRATLPERAELASVDARIAELQARIDAVSATRAEVASRQDRIEADVAAAEGRIRDIEKRMYSGEVSASRELIAMSEEVAHLKARCSTLEDEGIVALEEQEPLEAEIAVLEEQRAGLDSEAMRIKALIAEAEVVLDKQISADDAARSELASGIGTDLLATYEQLRAKLGGVGAARLVGPSCQGCHLTLPATELERVRRAPPDDLVYCDHCGRILVR